MKNKKLNLYSMSAYTTADREIIFANTKLKNGFPIYYPVKNKLGKRVVISFVDAYICDSKKKRIDDEIANFDLLEQDHYDQNDPLAKTKIKFISALLAEDKLVQGGVYYKGNYYTSKMTIAKAKFLLKSFFNNYFYIEDGELLKEYFPTNKEERIPFWPTKSHNSSKVLMFSAVDATITNVVTGEKIGPLNFHIYAGELLDFNKEEDQARIDVIKTLIDDDRVVEGFYYKEKLLKKNLSKDLKEYLLKNFIKKNFCIEQKEQLLTYISKDEKSGYPIFWPTRDKENNPVCVSVMNAEADWIEKEEYRNFDVYDNEFFDLTKPEYQAKLKIMRSLYFNKGDVKGALYFDGLLVSSDVFSFNNMEHRRAKVEKALKIFITNSEDFININSKFNTSDREQLIRLSQYYDNYYPDNFNEVMNFLYGYGPKNANILCIKNANVVDQLGNYIFANNINEDIDISNTVNDGIIIELLYAIYDKTLKVRGGIYYKGVNIAQKRNTQSNEFFTKVMPKIIPNFDIDIVLKEKDKNDEFSVDKFSKLPLYWPTKDKEGRNVLLSVVDADIHFKVGLNVVKAVNNATFDIYEGETFGLVGESGSGKTTISRAILGINKLTKGAIYFRGKLISSKMSKEESLKTKKNIQMIFQDPAASLNERANIDYIISEGIYNFKMFKTNEERLAKVTSLLNSVGLLPEHLSRYPHEFSGGQRQRIGIARALAIEPQLVLADEPISALDVSIRAQVLNLLKKLQKENGLTYLFIAHDLSIIRYISDRIAVMHNGFIVELGVAEEIYTHPLHPYTRSLLTAIPQPDPKTKDNRKKIPYDQGNIVYEECRWVEMRPGHFVLVNDELEEKINKRIEKLKL